jgi:hypothetical protein
LRKSLIMNGNISKTKIIFNFNLKFKIYVI